jgi:hypothetical protein
MDYNYSTQSNWQNSIVQQIPLFGSIFEQASIITKVNVGMGTQRAALMFVRKKQIRQKTEQHGDSENL